MLATDLTMTITSENTTIPVTSTSGYLSSDYIYIGSEQIYYTATDDSNFLSCTRGYGGSDAAPHAVGSMVYTGSTNALNRMLGFNVGSMVTSAGIFSIITIPVTFFTTTIPYMVSLSATLLSGSLWLSIFGAIWMILIAGFIVTLAIVIGSAVAGLISRIT